MQTAEKPKKEKKKVAVLSLEERKELVSLESQVVTGMHKAFAVGQCLAVIRDKKLYRETHKNFPSYLRDRFGMKIRQANQFIAAHEVRVGLADKLPPGTQLPANEWQARILGALPEEKRPEVWGKALVDMKETGRKPSASSIAELAKQAGAVARIVETQAVKPVLRRIGHVTVESGRLLVCDPLHIAQGRFNDNIGENAGNTPALPGLDMAGCEQAAAEEGDCGQLEDASRAAGVAAGVGPGTKVLEIFALCRGSTLLELRVILNK